MYLLRVIRERRIVDIVEGVMTIGFLWKNFVFTDNHRRKLREMRGRRRY